MWSQDDIFANAYERKLQNRLFCFGSGDDGDGGTDGGAGEHAAIENLLAGGGSQEEIKQNFSAPVSQATLDAVAMADENNVSNAVSVPASTAMPPEVQNVINNVVNRTGGSPKPNVTSAAANYFNDPQMPVYDSMLSMQVGDKTAPVGYINAAQQPIGPEYNLETGTYGPQGDPYDEIKMDNPVDPYTGMDADQERALDQLAERYETAQLTNLPSAIGGLLGFVGTKNIENMSEAIAQGGTPMFDSRGQVQYVDQGGTLTGNVPVDQMFANNSADQDSAFAAPAPAPVVQAVEPVTPTQPFPPLPTPPFPTPNGMFYRPTSLDVAPMNVPMGFDFDAANRRFVESYAMRPDYYRQTPDLTGYTKLL